MNLAPLLAAVPPIPSHAFAAMAGTVIGIAQFALPKGTLRHRVLGWVFVVGLAYVAVTGLFIHTLQIWGQWSPIHLLSIATLALLVRAVLAARSGNIGRHSRAMTLIYLGALVVAGAFTLMPGRVMHNVVVGG
ncbi:DUF2306 domain-containing protein [Acuticoccus sp. MNP-M23]|uniref:DUF2306 domain-containing protein n=1 Tax=Acuticoccus sp. MNP-M23 TaxID=3072793 RepID=UPI002814E832|nr:DUF2306 domain-containing protein [Acuticoccus sp. MNP-M23]WMS42432.1 DUF2306 domain-containing protein [Acuticoccus sp. MNP-M23]